MDLRDIERAAREQGWRVGRTRKGHPMFYPPKLDVEPIVTSGTPSDQRALKNLVSRRRAAGLVWPWAGHRRRKA